MRSSRSFTGEATAVVVACRLFPRSDDAGLVLLGGGGGVFVFVVVLVDPFAVFAVVVKVSGCCCLVFGAAFPTKGNLDADLLRCTRLRDGELRGRAGFVAPVALPPVTFFNFFFLISSTVAAVALCRRGLVDIVREGYLRPSPLPLLLRYDDHSFVSPVNGRYFPCQSLQHVYYVEYIFIYFLLTCVNWRTQGKVFE